MSSVSVGISIDGAGTMLRIRRASDKSLIVQAAVSTPAEYTDLIKKVRELIDSHCPNDKIGAVATGIAGTIKRKRLNNSELGWNGRNLEHGLRQQLGAAHVIVRPLASMAALGEYSVGDDPIRSVAYVDWGNYFIAASTKDGANAPVVGIGDVSNKLAGRHLEDHFGKVLHELRAPEWEILVNDLESALHALVARSGCNHIVLSGIATTRLIKTLSIEGVKKRLGEWQGGLHHHVGLALPLCSYPALHGADLTAQRLVR